MKSKFLGIAGAAALFFPLVSVTGTATAAPVDPDTFPFVGNLSTATGPLHGPRPLTKAQIAELNRYANANGPINPDPHPRPFSSPDETASGTDRSATPPSQPKPSRRHKRDLSDQVAPTPAPDPFAEYPEDPLDQNMPEAAQAFADGDGWKIPAPTPGGKATGVVPAGLEQYYAQKVKWGSCEPFGYGDDNGAQCGYAIVPLDYTKPNGPTIAIGMLKIPAADPAHKLGTLFTDPGGPGGSGMEYAYYSAEDRSETFKKFDLIGFDPRGVGSSLPQIRCQSAAAFEAQRQGSDGLTGEQQDKMLQFNTNECYKNTAKGFVGLSGQTFIPQVGTANVIQDLDVMRSVVGDPKLSYIGFSYGTSIGYHYAQKFKQNIRALVLDGQVNPLENNTQLLSSDPYKKYMPAAKPEAPDVAQMRGFGQTFIQFVKACLAHDPRVVGQDGGDCALAEPGAAAIANPSKEEVQKAYQRYQSLAQAAWKAGYYSVSPEDGRAVSFADVNMGTLQAMYSSSLWKFLNRGLLELANNKSANLMMRLADYYYGRKEDGKYGFEDPAFRTISCTDSDEDSNNREEQAQIQHDSHAVAPFTDPGKDPDGKQRDEQAHYGWCKYYTTRAQLPKGTELSNAPNILVISSSYDPATPFENGVVAANLVHGTLLAAANDSHCAYGKKDCVTTITDEYLADPNQFTADVAAKKFATGEKYTGPTVSTKDIYSKVINAPTCQVFSFRLPPAVQAQGSKGLAANQVYQGDKLTLKASGFLPGKEVSFALHSTPLELGKAVADEAGVATLTATVPTDFPVGMHQAVATQGDLKAEAKVEVLAVSQKEEKKDSSATGSDAKPGLPAKPAKPNTPSSPGKPDQPGKPGKPGEGVTVGSDAGQKASSLHEATDPSAPTAAQHIQNYILSTTGAQATMIVLVASGLTAAGLALLVFSRWRKTNI